MAGLLVQEKSAFRFFGRRTLRASHVRDDVVAELRALDLRRAVHEPCEIVGDAFAADEVIENCIRPSPQPRHCRD